MAGRWGTLLKRLFRATEHGLGHFAAFMPQPVDGQGIALDSVKNAEGETIQRPRTQITARVEIREATGADAGLFGQKLVGEGIAQTGGNIVVPVLRVLGIQLRDRQQLQLQSHAYG